VSRTVVRDALRILEARGLVDIRRGVGILVKPTSVDAYADAVAMLLLRSELTIGDVFDARSTLEGQLAFVAAANHTPELLTRVSEALQRFDVAVAGGAEGAIVGTHVDFHTALLRATNLPALDVLLSPIQGLMLATSLSAQGLDPVDPRAWRVDIHRGLFEAVASRDPLTVAAANEAHWAAPTRDESYRALRQMRIGERFPTPRDLLRDSHLTSALWVAR
jgi:DNA-binding FadR family transcriptional regulator